MSYVTGLRCVHCARTYHAEDVEYFCPACGYDDGILDVVYDYEAVKSELNASALAENGDFSIWRYLPLLPVNDRTLIPRLQVGWTPLYDVPRLAGELGVARCWVKDEGRNPTASFKDRASAVGVVKALEKKASRITCASTGNAASSLAGFAAAAGIPATIFVPARAPQAKVAQLLVYGAQVFSVQGTYDEAWELCMKASAEFGWYNRNCAINPYLIEGKKTVSLELAEQFMRIAPGSFPDWVVVSGRRWLHDRRRVEGPAGDASSRLHSPPAAHPRRAGGWMQAVSSPRGENKSSLAPCAAEYSCGFHRRRTSAQLQQGHERRDRVGRRICCRHRRRDS